MPTCASWSLIVADRLEIPLSLRVQSWRVGHACLCIANGAMVIYGDNVACLRVPELGNIHARLGDVVRGSQISRPSQLLGVMYSYRRTASRAPCCEPNTDAFQHFFRNVTDIC